jgi:O-antigen ligase
MQAPPNVGLGYAPQPTSAQRAGFPLLIVFMFLSISRVGDFVVPYLHIPFIVSFLALLACALGNGLRKAVDNRVGTLFLLFTFWLCVATLFSTWRGGSYMMLTELWFKSYLVFVLVAGLVTSLQDCRKLMYVFAYASLTIFALSLVFRVDRGDGRIYLSHGTLSNPNDTAQLLLMGIPFWYLMMVTKEHNAIRRMFAFFCVLPVLKILLATGSRGALLAVVSMMLVVFWRATLQSKLKWTVIGAVGFVAVFLVLPSSLRNRYATMFGGHSTESTAEFEREALDSKEQRTALLKQSIRLTFKHPIFGVGPGVYPVAANQESMSFNQRGAWLETHNAYTQVSSEGGFPALFFFVGVIVTCFKMIAQVLRASSKRPQLEHLQNMARCQMLSLLGFAVTSFFSSVAYSLYLPALAGLTIVLYEQANREVRAYGLSVQPAVYQPMIGMHMGNVTPRSLAASDSAAALNAASRRK